MCQSCDLHVEGLWAHLALGQRLRTPDNARGADFEIDRRTNAQIRIAPQGITIPTRAFAAALHYLHEHGHRAGNPCEIASSNDPDTSGPLCDATRAEMPDGRRCVNYVVAILGHFGIVGLDGRRPNRVWVIP